MSEARRVLETRLGRFSSARRGILNAVLGYRLGTWGLAVGILALVLLTGRIPNAFVSLGLFAAGAAALLFLALRYLLRRERFRSHLDEAFRMENLAGGMNSRVVSALDFATWEKQSSLTQVVIRRAQEDVQPDHEARLDRRQRNEHRKRFAASLALFLLLGFCPAYHFSRLLEHWRASFFLVKEYFFPTLYQVFPGPGKHIHKIGESVEVAIQFAARGYSEVTLVEATNEGEKRPLLPVSAAGRAGQTYRGETESEYRLHFEFGRRQTDAMIVLFTKLPVLENMQTELVYPTYTRLLPRDLEGIQERLVGLPGTKITMGFTFSKDLESAAFTFDDGEELPLDVVGRFASTTLVVSRPRRATLQIKDIHGFALEIPPSLEFEIQNDEPPKVYLPEHLKSEMPALAEELKFFGFGVRAQDDFGVSRCLLKWWKSTIQDPSKILEKGEVEQWVSPPRPKAVATYEKIFEHLAVQPGDKINFQVEVYDNRMPKNQMVSSPVRSLFIHQAGLEDLTLLGLPDFGSGLIGRARVAKSKRAISVKAPIDLRTTEKVRNEFEAPVSTSTRSPRVRGEYQNAVQHYFKLMSGSTYKPGEE